jgi:hypothetical protein
VKLDVDPPLDDALLAGLEPVLRDALARPETHPSYASAWRRAAAREAVGNESRPPAYALSPRRTRGATRA